MIELRSLLFSLVQVVIDEAEKNAAFRKSLEKAILDNMEKNGKNSSQRDEIWAIFDEGEEILSKKLESKEYKKDALISLADDLGIALTGADKKTKKTIASKIVEGMKQQKALGRATEPAVEMSGMVEKSSNTDNFPATEMLSNDAKEDTKEENASISAEAATDLADAFESDDKATAEDEWNETAPSELFNPIEIYLRDGPEALRKRLEIMELEELRSLIREHHLDRTNKSLKWKNREKVIEKILERTEARATKGDIFLNFIG